ncbi:hypothetical protein BW14_06630 [Bifidobacterium sp. UTBIF-68]|nr:hypothetical protein BW14_06630 [Bifidobacterium sp. UTBIF-68]
MLDPSEYTLLGFDSSKAGVVPVTVKLNVDGSKVARFRVRVQNVTNLAYKFRSSAAASDVQTMWSTSKASDASDGNLGTNWSNWKDKSENAPANPAWINWTFDQAYKLGDLEFYVDQTKAEAAPAQFQVQYLGEDGKWVDTDLIGKPDASKPAEPTVLDLSGLPATKAISLIVTPVDNGSDYPYVKVAEVKIFQAADPLPTLDSLTATVNPETKYTEGDLFSAAASGLKVEGKWTGEYTDELLPSEYTLSAADKDGNAVDLSQPLPAGDLTVTVSAVENPEVTTTFGLTVAPKQVQPEPDVTITGIGVAQNPTKTEYTVGETYSAEGLKVSAQLSNGTTRDLDASEYATAAFFDGSDHPVDLSKPFANAGTLTVTLTLKADKNITTTFTVTVKAKGGEQQPGGDKDNTAKPNTADQGGKLTDSGSNVTIVAAMAVVLILAGGILLLNRKRH